ncbi:MAG: hypothetical protein CMJ78_22010 [Planctomycetaceae bacterium]|nr:hypothetical protein [Planctomycetaceae bacterium]
MAKWLMFALMTVASWGVYGIFLHKGQVAMADPVNGRYKAFLFVGIAYFLVAVLAPIGVLVANKASWEMPGGGMFWSLVAGTVGAIGAFCVLLAFGAVPGVGPAKAKFVPVVMSIIFAGAPIVNAVISLSLHPPDGGLGSIRPQFIAGIVLAAIGGCLVTLYKDPKPVAADTQAPPSAPAEETSSE